MKWTATTRVVYLDTALINMMLQGDLTAEVLAPILSGQWWMAFSVAHHDDIVDASTATETAIRRVTTEHWNSVWFAPHFVIGREEIRALISGRNLERDDIMFSSPEEVAAAFPSDFRVEDLHGTRARYDSLRAVRASQKALLARGVQCSKDADKQGRQPPPITTERLKRLFCSSKGEGDERDEAIWRSIRATMLRQMDEASALKVVPEGEILLPNNRLLGLSPDLQKKIIDFFKNLERAIREDNRVRLLQLQKVAHSLMAAANPLRLTGPSFERYCTFASLIPTDYTPQIFSDIAQLRDLFHAWSKSGSCPGGLAMSEARCGAMLNVGEKHTASTDTDVMHVAALPYVDVLFADKRIVQYCCRRGSLLPDIHKSKLHKNGEFRSWLAAQCKN
jgi:hypothetical protein